MLTKNLEKLVLTGKASFNSYVCGGSQKNVLNVDNDRFIIITNLTYFDNVNSRNCEVSRTGLKTLLNNHQTTQLKIFSDKSFNNYVFRNNLNYTYDAIEDTFILSAGGHTQLQTYLIHESDVSFTFSMGTQILSNTVGPTKPESIAHPPPIDYGKDGQFSPINVLLIGQSNSVTNFYISHEGELGLKNQPLATKELMYPIDTGTNLLNTQDSFAYPVCIVHYVEILGNPTNIAATL
jgi:hypothetical protein